MGNREDSSGTDLDRTGIPRPDTSESAGPVGWLDALNTFLERAMKADLDTGC